MGGGRREGGGRCVPFIHSLVTFFFKFAFADRSTVSRKLSLVVWRRVCPATRACIGSVNGENEPVPEVRSAHALYEYTGHNFIKA